MAAKAFEAEFGRPEMVRCLHSLLNLAESTATFARVESMFQSSGWGKSRSICELWRENVWVVYCCLGQGTGYPKRSSIADWFLNKVNGMISAEKQDQLRCMAFCLAYFEACLAELVSCVESEPSLTAHQFVKRLYKSGDWLDDSQDDNGGFAEAGIRFWDNVKLRVEDLLPLYAIQGLFEAIGQTRGDCWKDWERRAALSMHPMSALARSRLSATGTWGVRILFVFDEARILVPEVLDKNVFLPLRRATAAFVQGSGILTLFADTTSRIAAPIWMDPSDPDPSDRMPGTNLKLATPIWACFWADHGIAEWNTMCARLGILEDDVLSEYWPLRYGRPLWWYMFKGFLDQGLEPMLALNEVIKLACDKLLGGAGGFAVHVHGKTALTGLMAIAVVSSRCALAIDPRCSAASTLVARNLMTIVKVDHSRECLYTDWPMEPILAQAAAKIMHGLDAKKRSKELYLPLVMALKEGWVSKGHLGELLARIILLRAFDKAEYRRGQSWCTLDEFLEALVGTSLLKLVPEQQLTDEVKELASSKLCFTSFHKIHKRSLDLTQQDFQAAAERRCALVAEDNTGGDDHFITDEKGTVRLHNRIKRMKSDSTVADLAKGSPPFCGVGSTSCFLSLHMNVLKRSDKVTLVDPCQVEQAVRHNKPNKVLEAVLDCEAEEKALPKRRRWESQRDKNPRLFQAWKDWLEMPRRNQVILKVHGLGAFKPLLGEELLCLFHDMSEDSWSELLDPSEEFENLQKLGVSNMFQVKNLG